MTTIRSLFAALSLSALSLGTAQAQTESPEETGVRVERPVKFTLGFGLTTGGDKLATADTYDDERENIRAGGGIDIKAGVDWRLASAFSLQATVGHHEDRVSDWGDHVGFRRSTVELLGHFRVMPQFRVGGGIRKTFDASFVSDINDVKESSDYSARVAPVLEAEYFFNPMFSLKGRLVSERFKSKATGTKVDGDHGGVYLGLYF